MIIRRNGCKFKPYLRSYIKILLSPRGPSYRNNSYRITAGSGTGSILPSRNT
jgi:hypothetical protein